MPNAKPTSLSCLRTLFLPRTHLASLCLLLMLLFTSTTNAALPYGYVNQGGLTWTPNNAKNSWNDANAYCTTSTINGQKGWRLPTKAELDGLYKSGAMNGKGWTLGYTWSSDTDIPGTHWYVDLDFGISSPNFDYSNLAVSCVR